MREHSALITAMGDVHLYFVPQLDPTHCMFPFSFIMNPTLPAHVNFLPGSSVVSAVRLSLTFLEETHVGGVVKSEGGACGGKLTTS